MADTQAENVIRKKPGRKPTGHDAVRSFRAPDELMARVKTWADAHGIPVATAIRRLVETGLKG